MIDRILAVPGLASQTLSFIYNLAALAEKHGWSADGIAAVISHESRFNPAAKNPIGSATGLIQFIESTARMLGTTTAALARMTAEEQLPYVEAYFSRTLGGRKPMNADEYLLPTYGRPDAIGKPDDFVLDRKDSPDPAEARRYHDNAGLDADHKGAITAGDIRKSLRSVIYAAKGQAILVPKDPPGADSPPPPVDSPPSPFSQPEWLRGRFAVEGSGSVCILRAGSIGPLVGVWQKALGVHITGVFDSTTSAATRVLQSRAGIAADGVVGSDTWRAFLLGATERAERKEREERSGISS